MATLVFMDFETQSEADLTITGGLKYALDTTTRALLLSWAIGNDEPVKLWCPDLSDELVPEVWATVAARMACIGTCPPDIVEALKQPDGYLVAHNMGFDRAIWQQVAVPDNGFPEIRIEQTLDTQSQFQASNLPGQLEWAGRMLGIGHKTVGGKAIMQRFARRQDPLPGSPLDIENLMAKGLSRAKAIESAISAWDLYLTYSVQDTALMRDVWNCTRPLDAQEWAVYWASERINDRGMMVDLDVCRGAVAYREEEAAHVAAECARLTNGAITSPTLTKQINEWVYDRLPDDLAETMVKARDDEGYVTRLTGDKNVMTRLLEEIALSDAPPADNVVELLELLQFGRSSSAVKYEKMLNQEVDSRIHGQFVFNGARHRWSSRGIQLHNLPRAALKNELDVLDMVAARVPIEKLREVGPVSSVLSKLLRPTVIAPEGKTLVWADYAAVEARMNPWLANSREAEDAVLSSFRNGEDLYLLNVEPIFGIPYEKVLERFAEGDPEIKAMRQASKVGCLALAFLGGVGALKAMARGYGMRFSDEEAQAIVGGWRDRNRWARRFGDKIQTAMFDAMNKPLTYYKAGLIQYVFIPGLMAGTLVALLPDGRPITYPKAKIEKKEKFGKMVDTITYLDGMARMSMWPGLAVENNTQFSAAGLLRDSIVEIEQTETEGEIVGHTHDEILMEAPVEVAAEVAERLVHKMITASKWAVGLPLAAEEAISWYYSKAV